ncbi:hypothetical protein LTR08_009124 [Meristemomyces frigidus]|nr:hypothetical protein LTR08_009124 [Meristemomyces frigidus]
MTTLTTNGFLSISRPSAGLRIAQVVGLTTTAFYYGVAASHSFSTTPAILRSPAPLLAKQWTTMRDSDKLSPAIVPVGLGALFGWLASREPRNSIPFILYAASASLLALCVPYTVFVMGPIEQRLAHKSHQLASVALTATDAEAGAEETVHQLVDRWALLNLGQVVLMGGAAELALWAALDQLSVVSAAVSLASGANSM